MVLGNNMSLLARLRRAVKKIKILLNYNFNIRWSLASSFGKSRKVLSFNDRPGLRLCIDEDQNNSENNNNDSHHEYYQRSISSPLLSTSSSFSSDEEDIDKKSELFIANFRKHLLLERQISLELRYARERSFSSSSPSSLSS
ncbi:hypothetical protein Leryth_003390 [Lithospermum erythrorhizon]|nr:hypothetical protein Leryth_003390 [Lithospermum erythrorhizon]